MSWIEPIFDRTEQDVEYAKQQIALGINDVEYKGCLNVTDLNRIENNTQYLSEVLTSLLYPSEVVTKSWTINSIPNDNDIKRILDNISKVMVSFRTPTDIEIMPETIRTYEDINAIEKNLYLIKVMVDDMISSFAECGDSECGEE